MQVTLLCKKSERRVLYMEASKEFVDVLVSFLLLPIGSVMKLIDGESKAGIARVFASVHQLDEVLMQADKKVLVDPKTTQDFMGSLFGVEATKADSIFKHSDHSYYRCRNTCSTIGIDDNTQRCSNCGNVMNIPVQVVEAPAGAPAAQRQLQQQAAESVQKKPSPGFVKENVAFMITDDLQVIPSSVTKSIALINSYKVQTMADLESIEVQIGPPEVLQLLKTSLTSMTVLNDVFQVRIPKYSFHPSR